MRVIACLFLVGLAAGRPQDSYLAPAASEAVSLYASPNEIVESYDEASDLFDLPQEAVAGYGGVPELLLPSEAVPTTYGLPQDDVITSPSEPAPTSYGLPHDDVITSPSEAASTTYGLPQDDIITSPSEAAPTSSYGLAQNDIITSPSEAAPNSYGLPRDEVISSPSESAPTSYYGQPRDEVLSSASQVVTTSSNGSPRTLAPSGSRGRTIPIRYKQPRGRLFIPATVAASQPVAIEVEEESVGERAGYFAAADSNEQAAYGQPLADNSLEAESQVREVTVSSGGRGLNTFSSISSSTGSLSKRVPEKIVRSEFSGPNEGNWNYFYETENGIKQEARSVLKTIGDVQVPVMSGSYSYVDADGLAYVVDWYADETGFHPTAPHLPKSVEPDHPEVAAAVREQLRFAAEEDSSAAAASSINSVRVKADNPNARRGSVTSQLVEDDLSAYSRPNTVSSYSIAEFSL